MAITTFNFMTLENLTTYHGELTAWAQAQIANATASSIKTVSISKDETTGVSTMHFYTVDAPVGEAQAAFSIELPHDYYTIAEIDELAQGLNGEIARVEGKADTAQAAADKAQEDVDALAGKVGDIPVDAEGVAEAETVIAYINKKAQEVLESASGNGAESAAAVEEKLDNYMASNDQAVADVDAKADGIAQDLADEVARATGKEAEIAGDLAGYKTTNDARVKAIEDDYLKAADKEELANGIKAISDDYLKAADRTALENADSAQVERIAVLEGKIVDLTGAMHFKGVKDAVPEGDALAGYVDGDVIIVGDKEYVFSGSAFVEFGDVSAEGERIGALEGRMDTAESDIDAETERATKAEEALSGRIDAMDAAYKAADAKVLSDAETKAGELDAALKTELQDVIDGVDAKFADYSTTEQMNAAIKVVDDKFANYSTTEQMEAAIAVVDGKFANYTNTEGMNTAITNAVDAEKALREQAEEAMDARVTALEDVTHSVGAIETEKITALFTQA